MFLFHSPKIEGPLTYFPFLDHVCIEEQKVYSLKLQTLSPQGLNISLNYPQYTTGGSIW